VRLGARPAEAKKTMLLNIPGVALQKWQKAAR
jgi:hypothetical protein